MMASTDGKIVEDYLRRMVEIRGTGAATSETSYYSALEKLLNDVGKLLDPQVICNGQMRDQGAGHPDFGLYSRKQCRMGAPKHGQGEIPERGVVEVKPLSDESWQTAKGGQATKYFDMYRSVLVSNYREFRLIGEDESGKPTEREFFCLASDEAAFWALAEHPVKTAREQGALLTEVLQRVMMNSALLTRPEDITWYLASHARDALAILEGNDGSTLEPLRTALESVLGIEFTGEKGEHFFRSTLIQTLFYGIFSAWVVWAKGGESGKFDWKSASYIMTVPMVRSLFEEVAKPSRLAPLGLMDVLDRTEEALNRVDRHAFFEVFDSGEAVQHFYEPFLEAYDPELRKQMGVWYTPREIVRYMVERVDRVLRTELNVADGLADKKVYVLDPCCGTGAYVVEVLRKIEETLRANCGDALVGQDVQEAARTRVFGFEIMSAPFVVAHWQVGNLLAELDAPVDPEKGERPAIFLTNALVGWEPPTDPKASLPLFPELEQERDQAEEIKREVPILVVLGNPPYNAFAGTSPEEEAGLVDPYKEGLTAQWKIGKFNLDELYVRFLRIAERRIAATGSGIVCYISSYSYLSDPSFVVVRQNLLNQFNRIWIDSLNGDSRETGKKTPTGDKDPSVFSTRYNRSGIRLGTAVGMFLKQPKQTGCARVAYRDFWGASKRQDLLGSLAVTQFDEQYEVADPQAWNRLSFRPRDVDNTYLSWPRVPELASIAPLDGLMEKRRGALIDIDRDALVGRMETYFDEGVDWPAFEATGNPLAKNASRFDAMQARTKALAEGEFDGEEIVRYIVRPFDVRHCYYTGIRPIWNEPRPKLWKQHMRGNRYLMTRPSGVAKPEGAPMFYTTCLGDNDAQKGHSKYIPFQHHEPADGMLKSRTVANISPQARIWLSQLGLPDPDSDPETAAAPWLHALAITYAPQYLAEHSDGIAIDWPRIPLPDDRTVLDSSTALGAKISDLLDSECDLPGVTCGSVAGHLGILGVVSATDLRVTAGWGRRQQGGVYPGDGKTVTRDWTGDEKSVLSSGFSSIGIAHDRGHSLLGRAVDVYLNESTCWRGVPEATWNCFIGGYQVIKKWLSYREEAILDRSLTKEEVREVTGMVRRLSALILLSDDLNRNYSRSRNCAKKW